MSTHVLLTHWETADTKKGKNLEYQKETIVYEMPLAKMFKTRAIDVLNQCQTDFGCKLSVRGRKEDGKKKAKLEAQKGTEVDKVHHITLRLLENPQQSQEERLRSLCEAERFVDAFLRNMLRSPDDQVYMFPPEDAAALERDWQCFRATTN